MRIVAVLAALYVATSAWVLLCSLKAGSAAIDFDDAFLYRELALPMAKRSLKCEQILRDEALEVFKAWTAKPDKVPY